ncbi:MAG: GNAT family N-acetyltransferase [Candidatus Thorarchaeota archaeon]
MSVVRAVFGFDEVSNNAVHGIYRTLLDKEDSPTILAEIDGAPVGISSSALRAGVVGLYNVGTVEEYRGKGIGQLVSLAALFEGRNQGYEIGILSSTEPGFNVYLKLGFKEYFRYRFYVDLPR